MTDVPLIEAVKAGNLATVEALLASGADIHQQDEQGWTPLNWAAGKGEAAMVTLLLRHGANVLQVGRDLRTPYMIALAAARVEAARLLREAEARAGGDRPPQPPRQYCKAYYLRDLRRFPAWSENPIAPPAAAEEEVAADGAVQGATDDDVVFIHQDFTVTQSMWHNENVLFQQITPAWEEFCTTVLHFKVPDDFDLLPETPGNEADHPLQGGGEENFNAQKGGIV
jgi:hypothetical protein